MSTGTAAILLWLFIINLGVAFGAGLYEHRIVVPYWITPGDAGAHWNPEAVRRDGHRTEILAVCHDGAADAPDPGESVCTMESIGLGSWLVSVPAATPKPDGTSQITDIRQPVWAARRLRVPAIAVSTVSAFCSSSTVNSSISIILGFSSATAHERSVPYMAISKCSTC